MEDVVFLRKEWCSLKFYKEKLKKNDEIVKQKSITLKNRNKIKYNEINTKFRKFPRNGIKNLTQLKSVDYVKV